MAQVTFQGSPISTNGNLADGRQIAVCGNRRALESNLSHDSVLVSGENRVGRVLVMTAAEIEHAFAVNFQNIAAVLDGGITAFAFGIRL